MDFHAVSAHTGEVLGTTELLILAGVIILLFGATKLPQLGAGLGQGIRNFKKSVNEPDALDVTPKSDEKKKDSDSNTDQDREESGGSS